MAEPDLYDPAAAWRRAGYYFLGCWVMAIISGAMFRIYRTPAIAGGNASARDWQLWTILSLSVVVLAYWVVWPKGTLTHGRERRWGWQLLMGIGWGVSEGLGMLSVWSVLRNFAFSPPWASVVTFGVTGAFLWVWHDKYWDIHVSPDHNIVEWNPRKVAYCHVPSLVVTLTHLAIYQEPVLFVAFQTLAIVGTVLAMRFPAPTDPPGPAPISGSPGGTRPHGTAAPAPWRRAVDRSRWPSR
ncbi:MAG TPA: hypothetical protein VGA13_08255 [Acidimicrobiales bacterium]